MRRNDPLVLHLSPDPLVGPSTDSILDAVIVARRLNDWDRAADLDRLAHGLDDLRITFRERLRAARAPERSGRA